MTTETARQAARTSAPRLGGRVWSSLIIIGLVGQLAWTVENNFTPPDRVGTVQGPRMIFGIMLPMVAGPFIGAAVITGANETYLDLGVVKQVPTPWIFLAAAVLFVLTIWPIRVLQKRSDAALHAVANEQNIKEIL